MHGREYLYVPNRIKSKPFRNAFCHNLNKLLSSCLGFLYFDKMEIILSIR